MDSETRRVSLRLFARQLAGWIDQIEFEGASLLLTRNGRPAAFVMPVTTGLRRRREQGSNDNVRPAEGPEQPPASEIPELSSVEQELLGLIADRMPHGWPETQLGRHMELYNLEMLGLIRMSWGVYFATPRGLLVERAIKGREALQHL